MRCHAGYIWLAILDATCAAAFLALYADGRDPVLLGAGVFAALNCVLAGIEAAVRAVPE